MTSMPRNDETLGIVRFPFTGDWRLPWEIVVPTYEEARKHSVEQRPAQGGGASPRTFNHALPISFPNGRLLAQPSHFPTLPRHTVT